MSMPISKPLLLLLATLSLVACGKSDADALNDAENAAAEEAALDGKVECALAGSTSFERTCTTERIAGSDSQLLVIRHADGGFRRFTVVKDGRGLEVADGADKAVVAISGDRVEVVVGEDRYRFPATGTPRRRSPPSRAAASGTPPEGSDRARSSARRVPALADDA